MYPPKPDGYVPKTPVGRQAGRLVAQARVGAGAGRSRRARRAVVRDAARRAVPIRGPRRIVGAQSARSGTTRGARSGSAAAPIIRAFTRSASIRATPRHVKVGVSCGGVWTTRDGGATWAADGHGMRAEFMPPERQFEPNVQDPHMRGAVPRRPRRALGAAPQRHLPVDRRRRGVVDARSPTSKPSAFGFAVAVHPQRPEDRVVRAGGQGREALSRRTAESSSPARATAAGRSDVLREGLPQQHAYDLVYRHALDVDDTGSSLAFGSTTGSVWVSDNGGDSWQGISAHLPPVYAVKFEH